MTSGQLAVAAGDHAQSLRRLLRALVAYGVFEEEAPDRFRLKRGGGIAKARRARIAACRGSVHGR